LPKLITNSIGMKLVLIRAGEFLMGSTAGEIDQYTAESGEFKLDPQDKRHEDLKRSYNPGAIRHEAPQHRVRITKPFYLGIYEVTQAEYQAVTKANPSYKYFPKNRAGKDTSRHPVDFVPWDDAVKFCRTLSEVPAEKDAGRVYRLPTEAEWEYACRAGSKGAYYFGDDKSKLGDYAWFAENAEIQTHPVGEKAPNAWGLYDMLGNATEWCADAWIVDYYSQSPRDDPVSPVENKFRHRRGGSFCHPSQMCRCAWRLIYSGCAYDSGFRVVCTTSEIAQLRRATSRSSPRGKE
jgi:formylglycine-generating enzyme required for sulfatase activity